MLLLSSLLASWGRLGQQLYSSIGNGPQLMLASIPSTLMHFRHSPGCGCSCRACHKYLPCPLCPPPPPCSLPSLSAISLAKLAASCGHISFVYLAKRMKFTRNPNKLPQKLNKLELIIKVGAQKKIYIYKEYRKGMRRRGQGAGGPNTTMEATAGAEFSRRLFVVKSFANALLLKQVRTHTHTYIYCIYILRYFQ